MTVKRLRDFGNLYVYECLVRVVRSIDVNL